MTMAFSGMDKDERQASGTPSGRFVFELDDFKPSREGLRAAGAPPCAPQAKILGDKPSREGFEAETLPGGFWGGTLPGGFSQRKPSCRQGLWRKP